MREHYHLDDPFLTRWFSWLGDVLSGRFGQSITYRDDVANLLGPRLITTTSLVAYALMVVIVVVGVGLGIVAAALARRTRQRRDPGPDVGGGGRAGFVAAAVLIFIFSVTLRWFPTFGSGEGVVDRLHHLTLPVLALTLASGSYVIRVTLGGAARRGGT